MEADENKAEGIPGSLDAEQRLVEDAKNGDGCARDILVERFQLLVARYLEKRMGERLLRFMSVEDLLQEVLMRGVKGLGRLREGARPEEFRGLLLRHAQWVLLDRGRRSGGFMGESTGLGARGAAQSADRSPLNEYFEKELSADGSVTVSDRDRWLKDLVSQLDEKYASVVRLYLTGRSYQEIGSELGISAEAARKRFLRAAMKLGNRAEEP